MSPLPLAILPLLFAQTAQAPAAPPGPRPTTPTLPSASGTEPSRAALPTQPTQPTPYAAPLDPLDTRTTREASAGKDPRAAADTRTTRDAQFDPRRPSQDSEQASRERAARIAQSLSPVGLRLTLVDADGRPIEIGGTDYIAHAAVIGGVNTNVVQTFDAEGNTIDNAAAFTGVDAVAIRRSWLGPETPLEFRLQGRGQTYVPFTDVDPPNDGLGLATITGAHPVGRYGTASFQLFGSVQTLGAVRATDGPLLIVQPGGVQRTYTLVGTRINLAVAHTDRFRTVWGVDGNISSTLRDVPVELPDGSLIQHRGIDFIEGGADVTTYYDLNMSNTPFVGLRYQPRYTAFLIDYTGLVPTYRGRATTHTVEGRIGLVHTWTPELISTTAVGAIEATAPPLDPDRRPILSPMFEHDMVYTRPTWLLLGSFVYTYGATIPRLGFGPTASLTGEIQGTPLPQRLRRFSVVGRANATRTAARQDASTVARATFVNLGMQGLYAVNNWFGVLGGYELRHTFFEGLAASPDVQSHVLFVGVSGYLSTDRTLPTSATFVPPIAPGQL